MAEIDYAHVVDENKYQLIELANVEIIYQPEEFMSQEKLLDAKAEISEHILQLTQFLAVNLSLSLQSPVVISDIKIIDGSVIAKFSVYIRDKLLMPAFAGYLAAMSVQAPAPAQPQQPPPIQKAIQEYHNETCKKIEIVTEDSIVEYDKMTGFKSSEITIKTKTIEEICAKMIKNLTITSS